MPAVYLSFGLIWGHVIRVNVRWRFGWLEYIIATPAFHHWHHTNDDRRDHNFAAVLPVVDMIFGTFYLPKHYRTVYGVDERPAPPLWAQLIDPLLPPPSKPRSKPQA